jgi:hypothetical protein
VVDRGCARRDRSADGAVPSDEETSAVEGVGMDSDAADAGGLRAEARLQNLGRNRVPRVT